MIKNHFEQHRRLRRATNPWMQTGLRAVGMPPIDDGSVAPNPDVLPPDDDDDEADLLIESTAEASRRVARLADGTSPGFVLPGWRAPSETD